jgi:hypothetical protein
VVAKAARVWWLAGLYVGGCGAVFCIVRTQYRTVKLNSMARIDALILYVTHNRYAYILVFQLSR